MHLPFVVVVVIVINGMGLEIGLENKAEIDAVLYIVLLWLSHQTLAQWEMDGLIKQVGSLAVAAISASSLSSTSSFYAFP